jgi:predicted O-methyltransferase YrrM
MVKILKHLVGSLYQYVKMHQHSEALRNPKELICHIYKGILHRAPLPGELQHWVASFSAGLDTNQMIGLILKSDEFAEIDRKLQKLFVPPGHFYSPVVNVDDVRNMLPRLTDATAYPKGIRIDEVAMLKQWEKFLPYLSEIPFPEEPSQGYRYHFQNPAFSYGDGSILYAMLRTYRPRHLIEVGSGYSSACLVDTVEHFLGGDVEITFIDPYPELLLQLLGDISLKQHQIVSKPVQDIDLSIFHRLGSGDFLFIDSTHVMKTGSDVCHEFFNILPTLNEGVLIHFHDIFWPFEYGSNWVIDENRSWNEIYGLRAFLMYNEMFEILFFNDYFVKNFEIIINEAYPAMLNDGGASIWLRKTG